METNKSLVYILLQELFENDLFDLDELADKYTMTSEQAHALQNIYDELYYCDEYDDLKPWQRYWVWLRRKRIWNIEILVGV